MRRLVETMTLPSRRKRLLGLEKAHREDKMPRRKEKEAHLVFNETRLVDREAQLVDKTRFPVLKVRHLVFKSHPPVGEMRFLEDKIAHSVETMRRLEDKMAHSVDKTTRPKVEASRGRSFLPRAHPATRWIAARFPRNTAAPAKTILSEPLR
jgi:hypothetical protein